MGDVALRLWIPDPVRNDVICNILIKAFQRKAYQTCSLLPAPYYLLLILLFPRLIDKPAYADRSHDYNNPQ
jgi:hypothetical protein